MNGIYRLMNILAVDGNTPCNHLNLHLAVIIKGALEELKPKPVATKPVTTEFDTKHDGIETLSEQFNALTAAPKKRTRRSHPAATTMVSRFNGKCRDCGQQIVRYYSNIGKNSKGLWVCAGCASTSHSEAV